MNAAIVEQGRLGDRALGRGRANIAASKRFITDLLNRFEAVAFGALVFVKRHREDLPTINEVFFSIRIGRLNFVPRTSWA